ncbi:type I-D CRISPR-associated protein Cas5/Csc1 [Cuniculiplasma sp. SKW3]|uniref:type I-D CRISPR-associated protein Cas5/Csc1 n=1 Tax=unclassified Cuniculiplasma TaxID=2619706 RepID=UPI003FD0D749
MEITPLKIETISPVNYYYIAAAGGMRSSSFIGDLALKYAALKQFGLLEYPLPDKFKPTYEELNDFDFWFTVAVNEKIAFEQGSDTLFMKNMIRNTMHGIDYNGTNQYPNAKEGSTMYKNFYFQQPIRPGNLFYCYLISKNRMEIPEAMRVGNGKTGIIKVSKLQSKNFGAVLNLYTIKKIMGLNISREDFPFTENLLLQYYLAGLFSVNEVEEIYAEWYS